jgi:hypothetical protein
MAVQPESGQTGYWRTFAPLASGVGPWQGLLPGEVVRRRFEIECRISSERALLPAQFGVLG